MELWAFFPVLLWAITKVIIVKGECGMSFSKFDEETTFDVLKFGAVGDGITDDTKAFDSAWAAACKYVGESVKVSVPVGKVFLLSPTEFGGPCNCRNFTFEIEGSIVAQPKSAWKNNKRGEWLKFQGVEGLSVVGNEIGVIDGQGDSWWQNASNARPAAMLFANCNNLEMSGLKHINSPKFHLSISNCNNAKISKLHIIAPATSPNTDGIDIFSSTNITIQNCTMETGDDCIAIKGGTSYMNISEIACGPGHGISIGSLGEGGQEDQVEAVSINNCTISGTQNGVRIKTWQGGSGFARNINFTNIIFEMADNPVVIDQFYCPHKTCSNKTMAVEVSDVRYSGLSGTTVSKKPTVNFRCSDVKQCTNIVVDGVDIKSSNGNPVSAFCLNAHGIARNTTSPIVDCLQP